MKLVVSVFGGASFAYGGREILLRNRKARAMLAYLALSENGEEQRERLVGLFWSEFGEKNARATLRQAVHETREAMVAAGCDALTTSRTSVGLRKSLFTLDLDELRAGVVRCEAPSLLFRQPRLAETFLGGFEDIDPAFHVWLTARRQTVHDTLIRGLEDGYRRTDLERRARRRLAEAALLLDPTHEEACRIVMRGEVAAALRAYDDMYRLLGEEYDMEPSLPTQELVADIKQGKFDTPAPPRALTETQQREPYVEEIRQAQVAPRRATEQHRPVAAPPKPTLFVESFAMSGIDLDQVHLVAGFRIELIACLTRFREWYVSGSSDHGADLGSSAISRRYTLSTTAYKAGATINVVMVLQEPPSELAIWGERFELSLDNWFEAQQRIIRRIAATLNVQLSVERLIRLSQVPDGSMEAHDIWLRGQMVINGYMAGEWNRVARMLVEAIDREPNFSPLYSSLAQMNNVIHFVQPGLFRDDRHIQQTLTLAQRAATLDPRDSRAQLCLGWALAFCRRYGQAELHMEIACEFNSNDPHTLMSSAAFYGYKGETKHALKQAMTSMELSVVPTLTQWQYLANIRYLDGDYEGAIVAAERAQDGLLTMPALRAAALSSLGRKEAAAQEVSRFYANVRAAWSGNQPPTDELISKWLLHIYPFSREEAWERMRDGFALAGIPVAGLTYHG